MLGKIYITEWQKLRHSKLSLAILILPLVATIMGSFNYSQNLGILTNEWYSLWTQVGLFYSHFFFPASVGLYCAYICRLEHTRNNWYAVFTTPISYSSIFAGKLLAAISLNLITQLFTAILYLVAGYLLGLRSSIPPQFFLWILLGWFASTAIAAFLLCLSLIIRSFAIPIGMGVAGGIGGFILISKGYPLSFPFALFCASMNTNTPEILLEPYFCIQILLSSLLFIIVFSLIGIKYLKHSQV